MAKRFYSNGKLLLTGEYLVLDGANALALPTKHGQDLIAEKIKEAKIYWKSFDHDRSVWFEDTLLFPEIINLQETRSDSVKATLIKILREAHLLNPEILGNTNGFIVSTHLTFPRNWGLGTSSTLINNIAQWFGVDAFELLRNSFGGSGYDIACAQNDKPVSYRLENGNPVVEKANFSWPFTEKLYFVYLNRKQNSKSAIAAYKAKKGDLTDNIAEINALTGAILNAVDFKDFTAALEKHERAISGILGQPTIGETLFRDFPGTIKSLGAWGGDFILAASQADPSRYFKNKGYETVVRYRDMIL